MKSHSGCSKKLNTLWAWLFVSLLSLSTGVTIAQTKEAASESPASQAPAPDANAPQAVRRGNDLLVSGDAAAALKAYDRAKQLRPDAREVAFVKGLAHYDLGEYEQAREAFLQAAATANDKLADDARYGLATCDHAEALQSKEDPQKAVSQLEDAMRQYQGVLANRPDHKLARESNYKAASMWRQIKEMMQQQQQQQPQEGDENNEDQENQEEQEQNQQDSQDQENQDQQSEQQQSQQQDQKNQDKQQQKQSEQNQEQQEQQQQQSEAQKQERVSREQAERKLREMMQELRDRKKKRRQPVRPIPVKPVEKDW